jgi:hypothetical protein
LPSFPTQALHKNLLLKSLYPLKKPHQNPWRSFKDLSMTAGSDFGLYYVMISEV